MKLDKKGELCLEQVVQEQLASYGVPSYKLDKSYVEISVKSRILFLKDLLNELERKE